MAKKQKGYFHEEQEDAFVRYLAAEGKERNDIFVKELQPALTKLVSSIIRTYELYIPGEDFEDTFPDAMSFLVSKMDKFNVESGNKAYSYLGNVCKNYLLGRINTYNKMQRRYVWSDEMITNEYGENEYTDVADDNGEGAKYKEQLDKLMTTVSSEIKEIVEHNEENNLSEIELKVGNALVYLFENWEEMFEGCESNKFNRQAVLFFLKEYTLLSAANIRKGMKPYIKVYDKLKENILS